MKYEKVERYADGQFRRVTGVKRKTFENVLAKDLILLLEFTIMNFN